MKKETGITLVIFCLLLVLAGMFYLRSGAGGRTGAEDGAWEALEAAASPLPEGSVPEGQPEKAPASDCAVYICGAVKRPGVYYFSPNARVCDAVEAAGGFTKKADIQAVNQARVMADGEQITIPKRIPAEKGRNDSAKDGMESDSRSTAADGRININTAGLAELMTIPGIGEAKAQLILDYRAENGNFQSTEDIMKISGIKEGIYNRIKDCIVI